MLISTFWTSVLDLIFYSWSCFPRIKQLIQSRMDQVAVTLHGESGAGGKNISIDAGRWSCQELLSRWKRLSCAVMRRTVTCGHILHWSPSWAAFLRCLLLSHLNWRPYPKPTIICIIWRNFYTGHTSSSLNPQSVSFKRVSGDGKAWNDLAWCRRIGSSNTVDFRLGRCSLNHRPVIRLCSLSTGFCNSVKILGSAADQTKISKNS